MSEVAKSRRGCIHTPVTQLLVEMQRYYPPLLLHHEVIKWQGRDLKLKRVFPKKSFSRTQYFSENGSLQPKYEHQGSTLKKSAIFFFVIVVQVNVCHMRDKFVDGVIDEKH
jgi:hypothetical protein